MDFYRGLTSGQQVQPRLGASYLFKPTNTVFRLSYSQFYETPYNENLLISSQTGPGGLGGNVFSEFGTAPLRPGTRDQYNVGVQQGIGKHLLVDAGYFWKYTHNAFDFDNLFTTPITFPIEWRKSKIDGAAARITLTDLHGFTAYMILGHTRARFFGPENGGLIFNSPLSDSVFRIDHDQALETDHEPALPAEEQRTLGVFHVALRQRRGRRSRLHSRGCVCAYRRPAGIDRVPLRVDLRDDLQPDYGMPGRQCLGEPGADSRSRARRTTIRIPRAWRREICSMSRSATIIFFTRTGSGTGYS